MRLNAASGISGTDSGKERSPGLNLGFMSWLILTLAALLIGFVSLRYALPHVPHPAPLSNFLDRRDWLIAHALFASIALLAGPWQFLASVRRRWPAVHRLTGRVYCLAVLLGWIASLPIASHAQTGIVASAGFVSLGAAWIVTTAAGYFAIRRGRWREHREWMIVSYALTASAITLRIYLGAIGVFHIPFAVGYPADAWACWVPNLIFAGWLVRRERQSVRFRSPATLPVH